MRVVCSLVGQPRGARQRRTNGRAEVLTGPWTWTIVILSMLVILMVMLAWVAAVGPTGTGEVRWLEQQCVRGAWAAMYVWICV